MRRCIEHTVHSYVRNKITPDRNDLLHLQVSYIVLI